MIYWLWEKKPSVIILIIIPVARAVEIPRDRLTALWVDKYFNTNSFLQLRIAIVIIPHEQDLRVDETNVLGSDPHRLSWQWSGRTVAYSWFMVRRRSPFGSTRQLLANLVPHGTLILRVDPFVSHSGSVAEYPPLGPSNCTYIATLMVRLLRLPGVRWSYLGPPPPFLNPSFDCRDLGFHPKTTATYTINRP